MQRRILIMAGGTGGHVFPALAVARALQDRGDQILWLGGRGRLEERVVPQQGLPIAYLHVSGIRRRGGRAWLQAPVMVGRAVCEAVRVIRGFHPHAVLGFGGYVSGPGGVAAALLRVPLVIHEQNAAAGMTNRLLSRLAARVLLGFPGALTGSRVLLTGNPVRAEILALHGCKRDFSAVPLRVLVVGGSLGAAALNAAVPAILRQLTVPLQVTHQCGAGRETAVRAAYAGAPFAVTVREFIDDMAAAYRAHDVVICRAGALTVAEVACAGLPALFVPLPTAVDDHQTKNAGRLVAAGAAALFPQATLADGALGRELTAWVGDRARLARMSAAATQAALTTATERVCEAVETACHG